MTAKRKRAPGKGERIALSGYVPQTYYQIELIIEHMLQEELEQFEFASLQAGIADDLILFLTGKRIKAYQFKHHSEGFLTFADLIDSAENKPRLLYQISQAWQKIKVLHQDRQIEIILVTNVPASIKTSNQKRAADSFDTLEHTLKNFLSEVWLPFRLNLAQGGNGYEIVPSAWNEKFSEWREATGLSKQKFSEFAQSFNILTEREPHPERRLADEQDINLLYRWFQRLIAEYASSNDPILITDKELKDYLGADRFTYRNRHIFPITSLYDPIEATREKLLQSIEKYTSGYVAVLGSPGSGKSSLLERTLRAGFRSHKVIPYYAFLPDDSYIVHSRLEATNFLHDLIKRIEEETGRKNKVLPKQDELTALRARLAELLKYLEQEFTKTGQRTIIMVDGLDHVERPGNESVALSMLSALPEPDQILEGVLFVFGSQYLNLKTLSISIQSHIRKDADRQIEMARLSNTQVECIIEKAGVAQSLKAQTNEYIYRQRIDKIGSISEGHPLALGILVNRLRDALMSGDIIDNILEQTPKYQESIYNQYEYLWTQIEESNRPRMRELVGQVARLWPDIDFRWVRTWEDLREPVQEFENRFKHLFVKFAPNRWRFFHNSFRLFLLDKSIETIDGPDPSEGERYHQKLAERCEACKNGSEHGWQFIYHLSQAGKLDKLFEVASASWFEKEYMEFRPAFEIAKDAHLCLRRAVQARKPHLIARYMLLWHRYDHTGNILAESKQEGKLLELLLDCGLKNIAIHRILAEYRLFNATSQYDRIRQQTGMLWLIDRFAECGETEFSAVLLDKCEPCELLDGEKEADCSHDHIAGELIELFESWAILALRFHDASIVLARLNQIRWRQRSTSDSAKQNIVKLSNDEQNSLVQGILIRVAKKLLIQKRWDCFDQVIRCLEKPWWNKHTTPFWLGEIMVEALYTSKEDLVRERRYKDNIVTRLPAEEVDITIKRLRKKSQDRDNVLFEVAQTILNLAVALLPDKDEAVKYSSLLNFTEIQAIIVRELISQSPNSVIRLHPLEQYITLQTFIGTPLTTPGRLANDLLDKTNLTIDRREAFFTTIIARIRLAVLKGLALRHRIGKPVDLLECKEHFFYLTTYFNRPQKRNFDFHFQHSTILISELLTNAIKSASEIGNDALQILVDQIKIVWNGQDETPPWTDELRYSVLSTLKSHSIAHDLVQSEIVKFVEAPVKCEDDTYSWIEKRFRRSRDLLWLNRKDEAVEELKRALLCAFSIRSEKDYQIATFMKWLPLAVEMTTSDDERRILLEEATQQVLLCNKAGTGADDAAQSIITATALWSPTRACQLLHELFRDLLGGRSIPEGVAAFIRGCLSIENNATDKLSSSVLATLTGLFNTLCLGSEIYGREILDLAHDLVVAAPLVGKVNRKEVAHRIWSAAYFAMPDGEDRQRLANVLSHALPNPKDRIEAGLFPGDIPKPESPYLREGTEQPYPLELHDGRKLHREEVITLILENPKITESLVKEEKKDLEKSYQRFNWDDVLRIIFPHLNISDQNEVLRSLLAAGNRSHDLFISMRHLAAKGELICKAEAINAAIEVISQEDVSRGWVLWHDGGGRLAALNLLVILNKEKYQSVAYDQLDQALSGRMYIDGLIIWMKEILQLFVTSGELKPIAVEITKHREGIFKGLDEPPRKALEAFSNNLAKSTADTIETAICGFLIEQLGSPVWYISKRAMTELIWLFEVDENTVEKELRRNLLEDDEVVQERALLLCERLVHHKGLRSLRNELEELSKSENYAVAESARRILQVQGITPPDHKYVRITNIAVPQEQRLFIPGEKDYDRELDLNRVFEPEFRVLADIRGIPQKHLEDEVRGIRVGLGWDSVKLETANQLLTGGYYWVRSNYERLSGITTRLALLHYIGRSIKSGALSYPLHNFLSNWFCGHDPELVDWWPSRRPTWITPFVDDPEKHSSKEEAFYWCQNLNDTLKKRFAKQTQWSTPGEEDDEWVVLGEKSLFEAGDEFRRVEERQSLWVFDSKLAPEATQKLQQYKEIFHEKHGLLFADYRANISDLGKIDSNAVLVLNQVYDFQVVTSNWLAILPSIMHNLECTLDSAFPPCWRNKRGETACVSIGWQDGTWKQRNYDRHSPAGKGWCVLMRAELWQEIEEILGGKAIFLTGVRRELYQPSESPYEAICTKVVVESDAF